jgi:hypothetical protein
MTDFPTFMNRDIKRPYDAQFSFPHGLATAAHLIPPGKEWQAGDTLANARALQQGWHRIINGRAIIQGAAVAALCVASLV